MITGKTRNCAKTGRRPISKRCSNCGHLFSYTGSHAKRNQHFFCSHECYIKFKTKKVAVSCDYCGTTFMKKAGDINRSNHNFCSQACNLAYRHRAGIGAWNHRVNGRVVHRKIAEDKYGRTLRPWEEVHHVDGNHFNNNPDNIIVLSKSDHSKIHASRKERKLNGQFTTQVTTP